MTVGVLVTFLATEIRQQQHSELVKIFVVFFTFSSDIEVFVLSPIALIAATLCNAFLFSLLFSLCSSATFKSDFSCERALNSFRLALSLLLL